MSILEEIKWYGRAGQGVITASGLLAHAAILEGRYAQAFPEFGPERLGSPISAFTRVSDEPIEIRSQIYHPTVLAIFDPTLLRRADVTRGLQEEGKIVINISERRRKELGLIPRGDVYAVDAINIAMGIMGKPIVSTAMLGAVARVTGLVAMASVEEAIRRRFEGSVAEKNAELAKMGFREVGRYG